jgi:hypothetical protein
MFKYLLLSFLVRVQYVCNIIAGLQSTVFEQSDLLNYEKMGKWTQNSLNFMSIFNGFLYTYVYHLSTQIVPHAIEEIRNDSRDNISDPLL